MRYLILGIAIVLIFAYVIYLERSGKIDEMYSGRDGSGDWGGPGGQGGDGGGDGD